MAKTYDRAGNFIDPRRGAEPYSPKQFWKQAAVRSFERISDVMKWIIPLAGLLIVGVVRFSAARRQQRQYIPVT